MKYLFLIISSIAFYNVKAQNISCLSNHFWGSDGTNNIIEFSLIGNTVTIEDTIIIPGDETYYGIGYGNNLITGGNNTFYTNSYGTPVYYNGTSWVKTDIETPGMSYQIGNPAGYEDFVYFSSPLNQNTSRAIFRFNGTSLIKIFETSVNKSLAVEDLAVDNAGNCWIIIGDEADDYSDSIYVLTPQGEIIHKYAFDFYTYNAYGCFFMDNTLYIGLGNFNSLNRNKLLPITFSGNAAIAGTMIEMPIMNTINDMASCSAGSVLTSINISSQKEEFKIYPIPSGNILNIENHKDINKTYSIYDVRGVLIMSVDSSSEITTIDIANLDRGLYYIQYDNSSGYYYKSFVKD